MSRSEAVAMLQEGNHRLTRLLAMLSEQERSRPATIGDGEWSAQDLLSHVTFWEELAVEVVEACQVGRRPLVERIFEGGSEGLDAANADSQRRTANLALEEVRRRSETARGSILRMIREMPDERWDAPLVYDSPHKPTLGALLGSVLGAPGQPFQHVHSHLPDLDAFVERLRAGDSRASPIAPNE